MGSFLFKWDHPATEVYVTGTFDDWAKSVKLDKKDGTLFEKMVDLPRSDEKYYYKFVVDDNWTTDHTAPQETDSANNTNNVLLPEDIIKHQSTSEFTTMSNVTPASTTAGLAANVPKEPSRDEGSSELPGAFPETPAAETQEFKVNPLPATAGIGNPISLKAGEAVPDPSTFTSNTVTSAVTTDKASYENGSAPPQLPAVVTPDAEREANGGGMFGLPAQTKNMIPESSLPLGGAAIAEKDPGFTIQSAAPQSTTAELASKVPLESRAVPEIVSESQAEAGFAPEASANPEAVKEKSEVEQELESKIPEEPATSTGEPAASAGTSGGITEAAAGAAAGATAAVAGAAAYATNGKIGGSATETKDATAIASTVPDVVQESITEAHQSPEAAASKEMVSEKSAMESELLKSVKTEEGAGEPAPTASAALSDSAPKALMKSTEEPLADTKASGLAAPATPSKQPIDSRDVSPMTRNDGTPAVTTGVASASTPTKSTAGTSSPASGKAEGSETKESKKSKRASGFFGKLKSKFSDKDKDKK